MEPCKIDGVSLDLNIAVSNDVPAACVEDFAAKKRLRIVTGAPGLGEQGGGFCLERERSGRLAHICTVDGPLRVEPEDLDEALLAMLLAPRWLFQITYSADLPERDVALIQALAKQIAKTGDGAVHDPQEDAILWPRSRPKRFVKKRDESPGPSIELAFFIPAGTGGAKLMEQYLRCCRRYLPEAVPRRYGTYEPMQHRLNGPEDDAEFLQLAEEQWQVGYGGSFFWKSTTPFEETTVFFGDHRRYAYHISNSHDPGRSRIRPRTLITGSVLSTPALRSDQWADALAGFVAAVSAATKAFYACASLTDWVWRGPSWIGIPDIPTWISWYGSPYRDAVPAVGPGIEVHDDGVLVRRARRPVSTELAGEHPVQPPARLVGSYRKDPQRIASEVPDSIPEGDLEP